MKVCVSNERLLQASPASQTGPKRLLTQRRLCPGTGGLRARTGCQSAAHSQTQYHEHCQASTQLHGLRKQRAHLSLLRVYTRGLLLAHLYSVAAIDGLQGAKQLLQVLDGLRRVARGAAAVDQWHEAVDGGDVHGVQLHARLPQQPLEGGLSRHMALRCAKVSWKSDFIV